MKRNNFECVSYIDDFLVVGESESSCQKALDFLLQLIPSLGMEVNWDKVVKPTTCLPFLGVSLDCVHRTMSLPEEKLADIKMSVKKWLSKKRFSKKDLQRMIGKLSWCSRVVIGGRTFCRNLINLMTALKLSHHHSRLNAAAKADLLWWKSGLDIFHGDMPFA